MLGQWIVFEKSEIGDFLHGEYICLKVALLRKGGIGFEESW